ncbi:hypothetical protein FEM48_Zijuj09G0216800 [Ziziphus jujuba var. spinosa]|uniref:Uncharacterized protein n=1 Tax=Ziziphus jujuba var. spinosa TaxID=714518 RepID=A0A978UVG8_ZIZJJ|nr:hypothetical protein FEM48_Zijuj09G0216800 [Ziziphus jujuba var. spinosa]
MASTTQKSVNGRARCDEAKAGDTQAEQHGFANRIPVPYGLVAQTKKLGRLLVPLFAHAYGISTLADAVMLMEFGFDGVFLSVYYSHLSKMVKVVKHYDDPTMHTMLWASPFLPIYNAGGFLLENFRNQWSPNFKFQKNQTVGISITYRLLRKSTIQERFSVSISSKGETDEDWNLGKAEEFGGGPRQRSGDDVVHPLKVSLEDLYFGTSNKLSLSWNVICSKCNGLVKLCKPVRKFLTLVGLWFWTPLMKTEDDRMDLSSNHYTCKPVWKFLDFGWFMALESIGED